MLISFIGNWLAIAKQMLFHYSQLRGPLAFTPLRISNCIFRTRLSDKGVVARGMGGEPMAIARCGVLGRYLQGASTNKIN